MGFKRRSGTREATLALSEIIKEASKKRPVLTTFIDVRAAYDSVIREVLYSKMLRMGIGGRFLTTVQGLYHSMEAELEVGGAMLGTVKMELGLAQGSPLSPVFFNIYINSCITDLEQMAHAKAAVSPGDPFGLEVPSALDDVIGNDRVLSLWFADDSSVVEHHIGRLQWLIDTLCELLRLIGLIMHKRKSKLMITMAQDAKAGPPLGGICLKIYGSVVETVTEFPHLGTMLNSRGNFKDAWNRAKKRASHAYHGALAGGVFFHAGSLASMVIFARAKIWAHFDALMGMTGAGGAFASAFYRTADDNINKVLRSVLGYAPWHREALRIESGIWDTRTRADMLVMRFFTKICSSDRDSLIWRVVRMSMQGLSDEILQCPDKKWSGITYVHRQSWTQQVLAAALRLGIPMADVRNMVPGMLLILQEGRLVNGLMMWEEVAMPLHFTPTWGHAVRLLIRGLPENCPVVEEVDFWVVRKEHVGEGPILLQLSEPLRLANFAAIRRLANIYRRSLVKVFVLAQSGGDSNLQGWAAVNGFSSFMPSYWHLHNVKDARLFGRARLHTGPNEGDRRTRAITTKDCGEVRGRRVDRIERRNLRACYLCEEVQGQPGVFMPESLHHMLVTCPNPRMETLRAKLKVDLLGLCATEDGLSVHPLPALSQSVMWSLMMLCTTSESFPVQPRRSARQRAALNAVDTRDEPPVFDRAEVVAAVNWLSPLVGEWMDRLRQYHKVGDTTVLPGAKVVALICAHMHRVFTEHRKALEGNVEYCRRSRDPGALL